MDVVPLPIAPLPLARPAAGSPDAAGPRDDAALRRAAESFEAVFLAEMLRHSGANALPGGFGGGAGEEAFASFLTQEQARLMAARGGIGLADHIFEALKARETAR